MIMGVLPRGSQSYARDAWEKKKEGGGGGKESSLPDFPDRERRRGLGYGQQNTRARSRVSVGKGDKVLK